MALLRSPNAPDEDRAIQLKIPLQRGLGRPSYDLQAGRRHPFPLHNPHESMALGKLTARLSTIRLLVTRITEKSDIDHRDSIKAT